MKFRLGLFNLNLILLAGVLGCQSPSPSDEEAKKQAREEKKLRTAIRVHLEVNRDGTDRNSPITINRATPFTVNIDNNPVLTEDRVVDASLVDDEFGGFQIKVQFNRKGTWLLEEYSNTQRGRRVAIMCQWTDKRWLAAPILDKRITNGVLLFTPDATREEAIKIVRGLQNVGKEVAEDDTRNLDPPK